MELESGTDDNELIIKQEDMCQVDIIEEDVDHETFEQQPSLKIRNLKVKSGHTFTVWPCAIYFRLTRLPAFFIVILYR